MTNYYIVLDVGGTEIKLNALSTEGDFLYEKHQHAPSFSQDSKKVICSHLCTLIDSVYRSFQAGDKLLGIGLAFPGPFDYTKGISLIKGQRKYEAIYGVNLKEVITSYLTAQDYPLVPIVFMNDASSFALGEYRKRPMIERGIYITIGTGCGSGLIEHGELVRNGYNLNAEGMIYDHPFRDGIIDEYLSANGLSEIALKANYPFTNGKDLARSAHEGDPAAKAIYHSFGQMIGEALNPFVKNFKPDEVVLGGQISKSLELFELGIQSAWKSWRPVLRKTTDTTTATLEGLYYSSIKTINDRRE